MDKKSKSISGLNITYWKIKTNEHLYISFIIDAYSHKIVGYQVAETLEAIEKASKPCKWLSLRL